MGTWQMDARHTITDARHDLVPDGVAPFPPEISRGVLAKDHNFVTRSSITGGTEVHNTLVHGHAADQRAPTPVDRHSCAIAGRTRNSIRITHWDKPDVGCRGRLSSPDATQARPPDGGQPTSRTWRYPHELTCNDSPGERMWRRCLRGAPRRSAVRPLSTSRGTPRNACVARRPMHDLESHPRQGATTTQLPQHLDGHPGVAQSTRAGL